MPPRYLEVVSDDGHNRIGRNVYTLALRTAMKQNEAVVKFGFDRTLKNPDYYEVLALLGYAASAENSDIKVEVVMQIRMLIHGLRNKALVILNLESVMDDCPVKEMLQRVMARVLRILKKDT